MAGSQLKRLKASLKDQGIIGPQQSKKQKRKNAEELKAKPDKRLHRGEALASIREQFNPFQFKTNARGPKFEVTTNKPAGDRAAMGIKGRPGQAKAMGEERVCSTLERHIVAGLLTETPSGVKLFSLRCSGVTRLEGLSTGASPRTTQMCPSRRR
jgi:hypothetical protein